MLQPFREAFEALAVEKIDKAQLKEIFEYMGQSLLEDEFEQQFQDIDTDGDGLISFEDFKRMLQSLNDNPDDLDFYTIPEEDFNPEKQRTLTADTLSLLTDIFERKKVPSQDGNKYVLDLKQVKYQLEQQKQNGQKIQVPLEVFEIFFGKFMQKKSIINMQEFSDLITEAEDKLFEIGGGQIQKSDMQQAEQVENTQNNFSLLRTPKKVKLGQTNQRQESPEKDQQIDQNNYTYEENFLQQKLTKAMSGTGTQYASKQRNDSVRLAREAETSLYAYTINELAAHTETPEVQLFEVLNILIDSENYEEFKPKDWTVFFKIFSKKFENVTQRINFIESKEEELKLQLQEAIAQRDDWQQEMNTLREENKEALQENDKLTQQNNEYASFLTVFQETQASEARLRNILSQTQNQNADLRAQVYQAKQNEKEAKDQFSSYIDEINELKIELQSAKQVILEEGNEKMRMRQDSIRQSILVSRQSTVQNMMSQNTSSPALQGIRESTVLRLGQKFSQEEAELKQMNSDLESKYMKTLQDAAKSTKISEAERKGLLMIAQQFDRYKKAYESVKKEKDQLQEENLQILKGVEKLDKVAEDRKKLNIKNRKEIEKLKTKADQYIQQREELIGQIDLLKVQITMVQQGVIKKVEQPPLSIDEPQSKTSFQVAKSKINGSNRATDVGAIKSRQFGMKQQDSETKNLINSSIEDQTMQEEKMMTMEDEFEQNFGTNRESSESFQMFGDILETQNTAENDDIGDYINSIRDSRVSGVGSFQITRTARNQARAEANSSDYLEVSRDQTWVPAVIQVNQQEKTLINSGNPSQPKTSTVGFVSQRKVSVRQFRPTILHKVAEDEEIDDEGRRSTIQSQIQDQIQLNDQEEFFEDNFEVNDESSRFSGSAVDRNAEYRSSNMVQKRLQSLGGDRLQTDAQEIDTEDLEEQELNPENESMQSDEMKKIDTLMNQLENLQNEEREKISFLMRQKKLITKQEFFQTIALRHKQNQIQVEKNSQLVQEIEKITAEKDAQLALEIQRVVAEKDQLFAQEIERLKAEQVAIQSANLTIEIEKVKADKDAQLINEIERIKAEKDAAQVLKLAQEIERVSREKDAQLQQAIERVNAEKDAQLEREIQKLVAEKEAAQVLLIAQEIEKARAEKDEQLSKEINEVRKQRDSIQEQEIEKIVAQKNVEFALQLQQEIARVKAEKDLQSAKEMERLKLEKDAQLTKEIDRVRTEKDTQFERELEKIVAEKEANQTMQLAQEIERVKIKKNAQLSKEIERVKAEKDAQFEREIEKLVAEKEAFYVVQLGQEIEKLKAEKDNQFVKEIQRVKAENEAKLEREIERVKAEKDAAYLAKWIADVEQVKAEIDQKWLEEIEKIKAGQVLILAKEIERVTDEKDAELAQAIERLKAEKDESMQQLVEQLKAEKDDTQVYQLTLEIERVKTEKDSQLALFVEKSKAEKKEAVQQALEQEKVKAEKEFSEAIEIEKLRAEKISAQVLQLNQEIERVKAEKDQQLFKEIERVKQEKETHLEREIEKVVAQKDNAQVKQLTQEIEKVKNEKDGHLAKEIDRVRAEKDAHFERELEKIVAEKDLAQVLQLAQEIEKVKLEKDAQLQREIERVKLEKDTNFEREIEKIIAQKDAAFAIILQREIERVKTEKAAAYVIQLAQDTEKIKFEKDTLLAEEIEKIKAENTAFSNQRMMKEFARINAEKKLQLDQEIEKVKAQKDAEFVKEIERLNADKDLQFQLEIERLKAEKDAAQVIILEQTIEKVKADKEAQIEQEIQKIVSAKEAAHVLHLAEEIERVRTEITAEKETVVVQQLATELARINAENEIQLAQEIEKIKAENMAFINARMMKEFEKNNAEKKLQLEQEIAKVKAQKDAEFVQEIEKTYSRVTETFKADLDDIETQLQEKQEEVYQHEAKNGRLLRQVNQLEQTLAAAKLASAEEIKSIQMEFEQQKEQLANKLNDEYEEKIEKQYGIKFREKYKKKINSLKQEIQVLLKKINNGFVRPDSKDAKQLEIERLMEVAIQNQNPIDERSSQKIEQVFFDDSEYGREDGSKVFFDEMQAADIAAELQFDFSRQTTTSFVVNVPSRSDNEDGQTVVVESNIFKAEKNFLKNIPNRSDYKDAQTIVGNSGINLEATNFEVNHQNRSENDDGQTIVGKSEDRIIIEKKEAVINFKEKVDEPQPEGNFVSKIQSPLEKQKGDFSGGLSFGKTMKNQAKPDQFENEKLSFYSRNDFQVNQEVNQEVNDQVNEEGSDSDDGQKFFMPNLRNRKMNMSDSIVSTGSIIVRDGFRAQSKPAEIKEDYYEEEQSSKDVDKILQQEISSFGKDSSQIKNAWGKPKSGGQIQTKEVSHFSEAEMEFKANDSESELQIVQTDEDEEDNDEEEINDFVPDLHIKPSYEGVSSTFFDQNLPQFGQKDQDQPVRKSLLGLRMSQKDALIVEKKVNKVHDLMVRASAVQRGNTRASHISVASNKKDFDYLFLTKRTNEKMYKPVAKILATYGESGANPVFSENIQQFNPELKVQDFIILITTRTLYLMDKKGNLKVKYELLKLRQIIMINTNPCIFALSFGGLGNPLLLQSFRRSELIIFLNTQCKDNKPKVNITRTKGIRIFLREKDSNKQFSKVITFEKVAQNSKQMSKDLIKQFEKNVQLNNFANAINSGYLKMRTSSFLLGSKWEDRFVVLTNVGLLYFVDPHQPPLDLFPVLDCEIVQKPEEVKQKENTFKLVYRTKHVTFQCSNEADFDNWIAQIAKLQKVTVEVREKLKQEEIRRMTMLMGKI